MKSTWNPLKSLRHWNPLKSLRQFQQSLRRWNRYGTEIHLKSLRHWNPLKSLRLVYSQRPVQVLLQLVHLVLDLRCTSWRRTWTARWRRRKHYFPTILIIVKSFWLMMRNQNRRNRQETGIMILQDWRKNREIIVMMWEMAMVRRLPTMRTMRTMIKLYYYINI